MPGTGNESPPSEDNGAVEDPIGEEDAQPEQDAAPPHQDAAPTHDAMQVEDATPPKDSAAADPPPVQDSAPPKDALPDAPPDAPPVKDAPSADAEGGDGASANGIVQTDIAISEIAIFQGVKVSLMKNGSATTSTYASIVAGRPGILRVYVKPGSAFRSRQVTAELTLTTATGTVVRLLNVNITKTSTEGDLGSTMNFALASDDLPGGTAQFGVRLIGSTASLSPTDPPAQYPTNAPSAAFEAVRSAKLRIVLVPVRYDADGTGRLPDTTASMVEEYRKAFFETYPVSAVDVTVRTAMPWNAAIGAENGWSEVLTQVIAQRAQDGVASDTYYLGIFKPHASFDTYCADGCVTGLAPLITNPTDASSRAGVAISYRTDPYYLRMSLDTAVHETGHMHGRSHVANDGTNPDCATPTGIDRSFPYTNGSIGSWGYGIVDKALYSPVTYSDVMGYCVDNWVSDYTFGALHGRVQAVTPLAKRISLPGGEYRFVQVSRDGNLRWGLTVNFPSAPSNNPTTVRTVDAKGTLSNITGYYYPYGDGEGGYMLVRKLDVSGKRLEIDLRGATRTLAASQ